MYGSLKARVRAVTPVMMISLYHLFLAHLGAVLCSFPSRRLIVIGVTGTKGKSSTTEMISSIFEEAGYTTALLNSIHIKIGSDVQKNTMRMSMPGRFFIQRFLLRALKNGAQVAILEMTSEGARMHRQRGIALDALVFTNLAPEHIESHGSFEAYEQAKLELGKQLERSRKRPRIMVANADNPHSKSYLELNVEKPIPYSLEKDSSHVSDQNGGHFTFEGTTIHIQLPGEFSLYNALAAATLTHALDVPIDTIKRGLERVSQIPGRAEKIYAGQDFTVVVDYAHTPDSLEAIYKAYSNSKKICVLGSMGGTRDSWNRPEKGRLAGEYCDTVILTDEDPCDDDPMSIIKQIAGGMKNKEPIIIRDRREAIRKAMDLAQPGSAVLITGKGTDPTIAGPRGTSIPWSDARVAREEIERVLKKV